MDVRAVLAAEVSLIDELESGSFASGKYLEVGGRDFWVLRLFLIFLSMMGVLSSSSLGRSPLFFASAAAWAYMDSHCSGDRTNSSYIDVGLNDSAIDVLLLEFPGPFLVKSLSPSRSPLASSSGVVLTLRIVSWTVASSACLSFSPPMNPPVVFDKDVLAGPVSCVGVVCTGVPWEDFQGT
jgi:hypothetical protein